MRGLSATHLRAAAMLGVAWDTRSKPNGAARSAQGRDLAVRQGFEPWVGI